jgi:hypothetical protein
VGCFVLRQSFVGRIESFHPEVYEKSKWFGKIIL